MHGQHSTDLFTKSGDEIGRAAAEIAKTIYWFESSEKLEWCVSQ